MPVTRAHMNVVVTSSATGDNSSRNLTVEFDSATLELYTVDLPKAELKMTMANTAYACTYGWLLKEGRAGVADRWFVMAATMRELCTTFGLRGLA